MIKNFIFTLLLFSMASVVKADDETMSCKDELGEQAAAVYVSQCIEISPATHPPCNDLNSCALIKDEINRGCEFARSTPDADIPKFCE